MSRRYKHIPGYTCGYGTRERTLRKTLANRRVRKAAEIINGMMYKKVYDSWDICDFKFLYFEKRVWVPYEIRRECKEWPCLKDARKAERAWCSWRK